MTPPRAPVAGLRDAPFPSGAPTHGPKLSSPDRSAGTRRPRALPGQMQPQGSPEQSQSQRSHTQLAEGKERALGEMGRPG